MKEKIDKLNEEKAFLMTENNFKIDYMDIMYNCPICRDTGIQDTGERCVCFQGAEAWGPTRTVEKTGQNI